MTWRRMGGGTLLRGWLHHACPKGNRNPCVTQDGPLRGELGRQHLVLLPALQDAEEMALGAIPRDLHWQTWASAGRCFARLVVQPLSPVPHPAALSMGVPQLRTPVTLPSPAQAAKRDLRPAACLSTAPRGRSTDPGRAATPPPFARAQEPSGCAGMRDPVAERHEPCPCVWLARGVEGTGKGTGWGTLRHVAGRQVATGAGSSSASPAQPPGTSYPGLGG